MTHQHSHQFLSYEEGQATLHMPRGTLWGKNSKLGKPKSLIMGNKPAGTLSWEGDSIFLMVKNPALCLEEDTISIF